MHLSDDHIYTKDGKEYQSVNKFLSQYKKPFPKEFIANKVAKRDGLEPEDVLDKWSLNAKVSSDYGNAIHQGVEYWIRYGEITKLPHVRDAVEQFAETHDREKLKSEIVVYSDDLMLSGTIDILEVNGKNVVLEDIKTNYEMDKKNGGYFLEPLDDLPDTKLNYYTLQLNTYRYLLELKGFKVDDMRILHWNGEEFKTLQVDKYEVEKLWKD